MCSNKRILITGAGGFIGRRLCVHFAGAGYVVHGLQRSAADIEGVRHMIQTDLADHQPQLSEHYDTVIHAAGLAHVRGSDSRLEARMQAVNVGGHATCAARWSG